MSSKSQRFAEVVLAAFATEGHTTDELVHDAGGPSSTYMTGLRKTAAGAEMKEPRSDTYRRIERAAGWKRGSGRRVWLGGEPETLNRSADVLREVLGLSPDVVVEERPRGPRKKRYFDGPEGFMERVFDRLLDLEEQVESMDARLTQLEEVGEEHDRSPATSEPASGPGKTKSDYAKAARTGEPALKKKRREHDAATEAIPEDPTGMEPI